MHRCPTSPLHLSWPHLLWLHGPTWFPSSASTAQDSSLRLAPFLSLSVRNTQVSFTSECTLFPPLPGHPEETELFLLCLHCTLSTTSSSSVTRVCLSVLPSNSKLPEGRGVCLVFPSTYICCLQQCQIHRSCSVNIYRTKKQVGSPLPILILYNEELIC